MAQRKYAIAIAATAGLALYAAAAVVAATVARAEIKIVATIKPIHALVAGVTEGIATPELLVSGSASPHTFTLTPDGARSLHGASVFFRVSPTVEPFTERILTALPLSVRVVTLADAPGVATLALRRSDTFEAHDHATDDLQASSSGTPGSADAPRTGDGHVWLDPENAKAMVTEIARVLSEVSPADAPRLADNARHVIAGIDALSQEITANLSGLGNRPYVVFHDAYHYFEHRYGLTPVGAITIGPEYQPGARRLSELRHKIAGLGAVCVFAEPQFSPRVVAAVTEGTPARFGTLDPEGALVAAGPGAYTQLLRNLSLNLRECLSAEGVTGEGG